MVDREIPTGGFQSDDRLDGSHSLSAENRQFGIQSPWHL
jgi:hypothetical protein